MKHTTLNYILKIWFIILFTAPILYLICFWFSNTHTSKNSMSYANAFNNFILYYLLAIIVQIVLSTIPMLMFWVIVIVVNSQPLKHLDKTLIISISGVGLTIGIFMVLLWTANPFNIDKDILMIMICNCICICAGSWIYNRTLSPK